MIENSVCGFFNFFKNIFYKLIEQCIKMLPKRVKRLIYVASILGIIKNINDSDVVLAKKLNMLFNIAKDSKALEFPMYIKSFIWRTINLNTHIELSNKTISISEIGNIILMESDYIDIGKWFSSKTPTWLTYGSNELLAFDASKIIRHLGELKTI